MTAQETTLIDVLEGRRATYQLICRFFRSEVDEAFLASLRETRFPAHTGEVSMDRGHRLVVSYLSHADADVLTELARDFSGTFIGSGNDAYSAAYPFESVYTNPKRLTMSDARDEVLMLYRAAAVAAIDVDDGHMVVAQLQGVEGAGVHALVAAHAALGQAPVAVHLGHAEHNVAHLAGFRIAQHGACGQPKGPGGAHVHALRAVRLVRAEVAPAGLEVHGWGAHVQDAVLQVGGTDGALGAHLAALLAVQAAAPKRHLVLTAGRAQQRLARHDLRAGAQGHESRGPDGAQGEGAAAEACSLGALLGGHLLLFGHLLLAFFLALVFHIG